MHHTHALFSNWKERAGFGKLELANRKKRSVVQFSHGIRAAPTPLYPTKVVGTLHGATMNVVLNVVPFFLGKPPITGPNPSFLPFRSFSLIPPAQALLHSRTRLGISIVDPARRP